MVTNNKNKIKSCFLILFKKMRKPAAKGYITMFVSFLACFGSVLSVLTQIEESRVTPSSHKYYSTLCSEVSQSIVEIKDDTVSSYHKEVSYLESEVERYEENLLPFLNTLESLLIKQKYNQIVFKNYDLMLKEIIDEFNKERTINEFAKRIVASYMPIISDTSYLYNLSSTRDQVSLILHKSLEWENYVKKKKLDEKMNHIREDNGTRSSKRALKKLYGTYYSKEYYAYRKAQVSVFMDWYRTIKKKQVENEPVICVVYDSIHRDQYLVHVVYDTCYGFGPYDSLPATTIDTILDTTDEKYFRIIKKKYIRCTK